MSALVLQRHESRLDDEWDSFVTTASDGHFLQSRRFLSYHGNRFEDESVLLRDDRSGRICAVFPAARNPAMPSVVTSHPGSTFGGLVHNHGIRGNDMTEVIEAISTHYTERGYGAVTIRLIPDFYLPSPCSEFEHGLWRAGGRLVAMGLSSTIQLTDERRVSHNFKRDLAAARSIVSVVGRSRPSRAFWSLLAENLGERHGVDPVHSWDEICYLADLLPGALRQYEAHLSGQLAAGALVFVHERAWHAQYIAASDAGRKCFALLPTLLQIMEDARAAGARVFDFGVSTVGSGTELNYGLHQFKQKFGRGSTTYRQYELTLL